MYKCFATTIRGLEQLLADELSTIGAIDIITVNAGIQFRATMDKIMQINLHSRLSSRVLIEIGHSKYRNEDDIYEYAVSLDYREWFDQHSTIKVMTSATQCPLKSLEFINLRLKDAICDFFMQKVTIRPSVNKHNPDVRIFSFLNKDSITIYIDTSGEALFKRGYRTFHEQAPIKENLAAGLVKLAKWNSDLTLFDPMCGSGTLVIEAIMIGLNIPPGLKRNFAFSKFPNFYRQQWDNILTDAKNQIHNKELSIYASDINADAINSIKRNLLAAELTKYVQCDCQDILLTRKPTDSGMMLANLPYGIRLDTSQPSEAFYTQLATTLKQHFSNWRCYFLHNDSNMEKLLRLKASKRNVVFNGAIECRLYEFKMVSGSNRDK
jgi:putative N6-adenine-specific DNA methylase